MASDLRKDSRYRILRGKSVSESRRDVKEPFSESFDGPPPQPLRYRKSGWLKRPKTQEHMQTAHASMDDLHSHMTHVPPLPLVQKEHTDNTRPKAAVMPSRPEFLPSRSPTPLDPQKADQATPPSTPPLKATVDDVAFSDKIAMCDDAVQKQKREPEDKVAARVEHTPEKGPEKADETTVEAALVVENLVETPKELEAAAAVQVTPPEEPFPFSNPAVEAGFLLAEQERLLHQQLMSPEYAGASMTSLASTSTFACTNRTPPKSPIFGKIGFFVRGRTARAATLSPAPSTAPSLSSSHTQSIEPLLPSSTRAGGTQLLMTPPASPISAPHRHSTHSVYVRYRGEYTTIPIVDSTDTVDILRQASELMTHPISPSSSVVLESYASLGLERRLRRYERVSEVVNSWPRDALNSLIIRPTSGLVSDKDLDFVSVPQTPPEFVLQLSHCSQSGKWQKRWVTLLNDGKIVISKKPNSNFSEKDCQRICHLSSCDIYTRTSEPAKLPESERKFKSPRTSPIKSLKPPKKLVFALKSQNRPATHLDPDNYVQYFCTDDQAIASAFHDGIHAWRSWYMVKVLRQSQRKRLTDTKNVDPPPQITPVKHKPKKSIGYLKVTPQHKKRISRDETPHTIGEVTAEPLIDVERFFNKPLEEYGDDWIPVLRESCTPHHDPGTVDSGVSMTVTPATGRFEGKHVLEASSPSAHRRERRDASKTPAAQDTNNTTEIVTAEGIAGVSISVTEPQSDATWATSQSQQTPLNPQPSPWLPSAAEHTALMKAKQASERQHTVVPSPNPQQHHRPVVVPAPVASHKSLQPPTGEQQRRRRRQQQQQQQHPLHHHSTRVKPALDAEVCSDWKIYTQHYSSSQQQQQQQQQQGSAGSGAQQRIMASRPSMPALSHSPSNRRKGGGGAGGVGVPQLWRAPSTSSIRPSTSGERASKLGQRSRGASVGAAQQVGGGGGGGGARKGSSGVLLLGGGGDVPPPVPGVPVHLRTARCEASVRAAAGMSAPGLLVGGPGVPGGRGWIGRPGEAGR